MGTLRNMELWVSKIGSQKVMAAEKAFVVMYYRSIEGGLTMLNTRGRIPLTLKEAKELANLHTTETGNETFIFTLVERYRRVAPVDHQPCHSWPY